LDITNDSDKAGAAYGMKKLDEYHEYTLKNIQSLSELARPKNRA